MTRKCEKWQQIVDAKNLDLSRPLNHVSATDIKRITNEEPRLMANLHRESDLPLVFKHKGVFILPVSGKEYVIVHGKGYHQLEPIDEEPEVFKARLPFELAMQSYGWGENRCLLHAYNTGLLAKFTNVPQMLLTFTGRGRTGDFKFKVDGSPEIMVKGAQMEIDMTFDAPNDVLLFESKASPRETFIIRQLYFPFRAVRNHTNKQVRCFFFVADQKQGTYSLWEYIWTNPFDYETIELVSKGIYVVDTSEPPMDKFERIEPDWNLNTVPQADDIEKVANYPLLVDSGIDNAKHWSQYYGLTVRQGSYYREAAEAIGLLTSTDGHFILTDLGKKYVKMDKQARSDFITEQILRIPIMNEVFRQLQKRPDVGMGKDEIAECIRKMSDLSGSTPLRRASTVLSYFKWISDTTGVVVVRKGRVYSRNGALDRFVGTNRRNQR